MQIKDMIVGGKYDKVEVLRIPDYEELKKFLGEVPFGCSAVIVKFLDDGNREDCIFETPVFSGMYIEQI